MRKSDAKFKEYEQKEDTDLTPYDLIERAVSRFNFEVNYGLKLWKEYRKYKKISLDLTDGAYSLAKDNEITFGLGENGYFRYCDFEGEKYLKHIRLKYWGYLLTNPILTGNMTSNLRQEYLKDLERLADYDFSYFNIKTIQADICKKLIKGVEDCIIAMFDKLSAQHSYDADMQNNIWYYDGWKTNKSWKINKKVILPCTAWDNDFKHWDFQWGKIGGWVKPIELLGDLEKVFNYLDNGETREIDISERLKEATEKQQSQKIELKYFTVTFYKKQTLHITFTNERLLKKFNIFGSQKKGWLPKGYGKKRYQEMTKEEQDVINSFEGVISYAETMTDSNYYLFEAGKSIPMLSGGQNDEKVS